MPAHDFDKNLQEKVQQLRLKPSPGVWAGVTEELNRIRRRRMVARISAAAAVVIGITLVMTGSISEKTLIPVVIHADSGNSTGVLPEITAEVSTLHSNSAQNNQLKTLRIDPNSTLSNKILTGNNNNPDSVSSGEKPGELQSGGSLKYDGEKNQINRSTDQPLHRTRVLEDLDDGGTDFSAGLIPAKVQDPLSIADLPVAIAPTSNKSLYQISPDRIKHSTLSKPDKWHISVVFGAGASTLVESGLQHYNAMANDYLATVAIPAGIAALQQRPSDVKTGPAFHLGAQVSRYISKKWSVGIGLRYAYVSNRITVGQTADSTTIFYTVRQNLNSNNPTFKAAGNSGENFYNQYHYVQLPVEIGLNFGSRQRWEYLAGVNIGHLVGVNAFQYNNQAGVYYRDNDNYRKWSASLQMGFQYRLPNSAKLPFQFGPFAQYQLSSLEISSSNKHLLSFGLEAKLQIK